MRLAIRLMLLMALAFFCTKLLAPLFSLFAPFVLALIVAALLNPIIRWIQQRFGLGRKLITLLLLIVLIGIIGGLIWGLVYLIGREVITLAQNWKPILDAFLETGMQLEGFMQRVFALLPKEILEYANTIFGNVYEWLLTWIPNVLSSAASAAGTTAMKVPSFLVALLMFVMASYFLSADYPYLRTQVASAMDETFSHFLRQVKDVAIVAFGGYVRSQVILSIAVFFILLIGFFVTGQSYAATLALFLAVLDFIPIIGAGTIMVPWAVVSLFTGDFSTAIELMVIWGIIVLFRRVAEPKIVGDQTGISPIASLISIYVGMRVAGVAGMILGPIAVMVLLNLAGLGLFRGMKSDVSAAVQDVAALLRERVDWTP